MHLVVAAILSLTTGCIVPVAISPLHAEIGGTEFVGQHHPAFHVAGGAALASVVTGRDQVFDVGVGGFLDAVDDAADTSGLYLDAAVFVDRSEQTRTSVGLRGEVRYIGGEIGSGLELRVERELYVRTTGSMKVENKCGLVSGKSHGNRALGVYGQGGRVWQADGMPAWTASAGITIRLPALVGFLFRIPGC